MELASDILVDPIEDDINLYRYCENNPLIYVDPMGEALTSIDGAVEACMKKPTAVARADCLEALIDIYKNGSYDLTKLTKCAKSMRDLANHLQKLKNAQNQLSQLQNALRTAKGKTNQEAIKKAIDALQKSINGHIKEIGQKWGKDALKECSCPK